MTIASVDDWKSDPDLMNPPLALQIVLLKRTYAFAWTQFLYAEGGNDEVRISFTTHDVLVKGSNLDSMITACADRGIGRIHEPTRPDRFGAATGPSIREISVVKIEPDRS